MLSTREPFAEPDATRRGGGCRSAAVGIVASSISGAWHLDRRADRPGRASWPGPRRFGTTDVRSCGALLRRVVSSGRFCHRDAEPQQPARVAGQDLLAFGRRARQAIDELSGDAGRSVWVVGAEQEPAGAEL